MEEIERICLNCGVKFKTKYKIKKYCCSKCCYQANYQYPPKAKRPKPKKYYCEECGGLLKKKGQTYYKNYPYNLYKCRCGNNILIKENNPD
jgi:hypothetical protein